MEKDSGFILQRVDKYKGFIQRGKKKVLLEIMFKFFDYIGTICPANDLSTNVFRFIFLFQLILVALRPFDVWLWKDGDLITKVLGVSSFFTFFAPSTAPFSTIFIFSLIFIIVCGLFLVSFLVSVYSFHKYSKINSYQANTVIFVVFLMIPYLNNIMGTMLGYYVASMINGDPQSWALPFSIIFFIFPLIFSSLQTKFVAPTLSFRSNCLSMLYADPLSKFMRACYIYSFLSSLSSCVDGATGAIIGFTSLLPLALMIKISFGNYIFQSIDFKISLRSVSIISAFFSIIMPSIRLGGKYCNETVVVAIIIAFFLLRFFLSQNDIKSGRLLLMNLKYLDDNLSLDGLEEEKLIDLIHSGYLYGHPSCHNWSAIDYALDRIGKQKKFIIMYARFVALYPNENGRLKQAASLLVSIKSKDTEVKKLLSDVRSLLMGRDRTLNKSIKLQLDQIRDKADKCRNSIRYIWESILRGNVLQIEQICGSLIEQENEVIRDYNHLQIIYPNNPFITSAMGDFYRNITYNITEAAELHRITKALRSGQRVKKERNFALAIHENSDLPSEELHDILMKKTYENEEDAYVIKDGDRSISSTVGGGTSIGDFKDEETTSIMDNQMKFIESMIHFVRIPTLQKAPYFVGFLTIFLVLLISLPFLIIISNQADNNLLVAQMVLNMAKINTQLMEIAKYTFQFVISKNSYAPTLRERFELVKSEIFNDSLPQLWDSDEEALRQSILDARISTNVFEGLLSSLQTTGYFPKTIALMFTNHFDFEKYNLNENNNADALSIEESNISFQGFIIYYLSEASNILNEPVLAENMPQFFAITHGSSTLVNILSILESTITEETQSYLNTTGQSLVIPLSICAVLLIIINYFSMTRLFRYIKEQKQKIFESFQSIPKSTVSAIIAKVNASTTRSGVQDNEIKLTVQEDNAIRIFSTQIRGQSRAAVLIIVVGTPLIFFLLSSIFLFYIMLQYPSNISSNLSRIFPTIGESLAIHTHISDILLSLFRISLSNIPTWATKHPDNISIPISLAESIIKNIGQDFVDACFGSNGTSSQGINGVSEELIYLWSHSTCNEDQNSELLDFFHCTSYETSFLIMEQMMGNVLQDYESLVPSDNTINLGFKWLEVLSKENLIEPTFDIIYSVIKEEIESVSSIVIIPAIVCLVVNALAGVIFILTHKMISYSSSRCLRLLLLCPSDIVLGSKQILKILSNDFSDENDSKNTKIQSFYETLASHFIDGVIFMDNFSTIRALNSSAEGLVGIKSEEMIGKTLQEILKAPPGYETKLHGFLTALNGAMDGLRPPQIESEVDILKESESVTLQLKLHAISITGEVQTTPSNKEGFAIICLVMKDMTSIIAARNLLQEEKEKGENLLNMILPTVIVKKLTKGEKNISFSVQTASITFIDIVSFTPWCASLPAQEVMKTLNDLYANMDNLVYKYPRMIKIKCIGDCYMAAGGVFDEVNQPQEHAREAVSFCLSVISSVELFNVEHQTTLKVRSGVNTGGPIIAGVLGTEKPTFDILGSPISIAAAMEHSGVPMNVHIPQHVYELVQDQKFRIKELDEKEIKGTKLKTYLVSGFDV